MSNKKRKAMVRGVMLVQQCCTPIVVAPIVVVEIRDRKCNRDRDKPVGVQNVILAQDGWTGKAKKESK